MNPVIEQRLAQMQIEIDTLKLVLSQFLSGAELDPQIQRTLTQILSNPSSKSATSENGSQAVNESGAGSYTITFLNPPDRFIRIGDNNVPAYD